MQQPTETTATAWLVPLSGPSSSPIQIYGEAGGATLGRGENCALPMPASADRISRQHARFVHNARGWRVADLNSRWGTTLNGVRLTPYREAQLGEGDLLRIDPWTFSFSTSGVPQRGLRSDDDGETNQTLVRTFSAQGDLESQPPAMGEDLLTLLLESAAVIHAAESETALAEALIDVAMRGTGLANAAVLRPLDAAGHIQVVAARRTSENVPAGFSRTLLATAAAGVVAELSAESGFTATQSMVALGISGAVCAPLMLGGAAAAFLYLDDRGVRGRAVRRGAAAFCLALARMASLALANLKRIEGEDRQKALEHDLSAAAEAQKWILPRRVTEAGRLCCTGESRAGAYVGGDFFDVLPLDDGRVVVALGDVSGHGVAAGLLMTAAQGFLHATLKQHGPICGAVTSLNRFIVPRRPPNCFLTLWVGVFDPARGTVDYVNAGHGYALLQGPGGEITMLDGGDDFPVGFDDTHAYGQTTAALPPGGRAIILSDGIVEQFDPGHAGPRRQFGLEGIRAVVAAKDGSDVVTALFTGVIEHAQSGTLQDDATAVVVTWS